MTRKQWIVETMSRAVGWKSVEGLHPKDAAWLADLVGYLEYAADAFVKRGHLEEDGPVVDTTKTICYQCKHHRTMPISGMPNVSHCASHSTTTTINGFAHCRDINDGQCAEFERQEWCTDPVSGELVKSWPSSASTLT